MMRKKMWEERRKYRRAMMRVVKRKGKRKGTCHLFLLEIDVI
jgi:hypothetical protein